MFNPVKKEQNGIISGIHESIELLSPSQHLVSIEE
jgi:hypothetical protein